MRLRFTKMQGAGNDFVVLDATREPFALNAAQIRHLADRHFGVGADQVLVVEPPRSAGTDFTYRVFNGGTGTEVEHCGNGARCFVRFVREHRLSDHDPLEVETKTRRLSLTEGAHGEVSVDMGAPVFPAEPVSTLDVGDGSRPEITRVSMGNPHAVQFVPDVDTAPVTTQGPLIETHPLFPEGVNAGYAQVLGPHAIRLRVWERGAGETLACGTGACAAVAAGIRAGTLQSPVTVETRGGTLTIEWPGGSGPLRMSGPAETVFEGEIEL